MREHTNSSFRINILQNRRWRRRTFNRENPLLYGILLIAGAANSGRPGDTPEIAKVGGRLLSFAIAVRAELDRRPDGNPSSATMSKARGIEKLA
jgi:hypothetical protein